MVAPKDKNKNELGFTGTLSVLTAVKITANVLFKNVGETTCSNKVIYLDVYMATGKLVRLVAS